MTSSNPSQSIPSPLQDDLNPLGSKHVRVIHVKVPKRPDLSIETDDKCIIFDQSKARYRSSDQRSFICKQDLVAPKAEGFRYMVRNDIKERLHNALVDAMQQRWHAEGLEPLHEIYFHDGQQYYSAVCVCRPRMSDFAKDFGLVEPMISREKARDIMLKEVEKWNLTPIAQ